MQRLAYTVEENDEGFVIRTKWVFATWERWLSVFGFGVVVWIFSRGLHASLLITNVLAIAAALIQVLRCIRTFTTCTTLTKFEVRPAGVFPYSYKPSSFVPMANIVYLTYREEESRGEDESLPAGLWAELERSSTCLVPFISQEEADELTLRIEHRFGDLIGCGIEPERTTSSLISLGLNISGQMAARRNMKQ